jgi:hypothetical protein
MKPHTSSDSIQNKDVKIWILFIILVHKNYVIDWWRACEAFTSIVKIFSNVALEGLAAVINRVTCSVPVPGSTLYVHACHPRGALPAPGLAGCPVGRGE